MLLQNTEYCARAHTHTSNNRVEQLQATGVSKFLSVTKVGGMQGLAGQGSMAEELNQKKHERLQQLRALRQDTRDSGPAWRSGEAAVQGRVWKRENWRILEMIRLLINETSFLPTKNEKTLEEAISPTGRGGRFDSQESN